MLNNSQDLLYVVLSLCLVWFTVFICWLLYQAARVLKNANEIMENITHKLELITDAIHFIKDKVDHVSSGMGVMSGMLASLAEKFVVNKLKNKLEDRAVVRESKKHKAKQRPPVMDA